MRPERLVSDFQRAEARFLTLRKQRQAGAIDDDAFRLQVARLLLRDQYGVFWMIDAETGEWICNRGTGWQPGDPQANADPAVVPPPRPSSPRRRWLLAAAGALVAGLLMTGGALWWFWPSMPWNSAGVAPAAEVQVRIVSPADRSQVFAGRDVRVESTIAVPAPLRGQGSRPDSIWVDIQVDGETVQSQVVQLAADPSSTGGLSASLSQPWRPAGSGEQQLTVWAFSRQGHVLGSATVVVQVVAPLDGPAAGADCRAAAALVEDVTIQAGMAFPPGARMDKVWQVQNTGSCDWGPGYELVQLAGSSLGADGPIPAPETAAGGEAEFTITFWAPAGTGVYTSTWQLRTPDGAVFGPDLMLSIEVERQAPSAVPPTAPALIQATAAEDGQTVRLSWEDLSDDEDAFRIYREDVGASLGLVPNGTTTFVDEQVSCGATYRYTVAAFNAAGMASSSPIEVTLPACAADRRPTLTLAVSPPEIRPLGVFTITFEAVDDVGIVEVRLWGLRTGDPAIDAGQAITCAGLGCTGAWPVTWTGTVSATVTFVGVAVDSSGQESDAAETTVTVQPPG